MKKRLLFSIVATVLLLSVCMSATSCATIANAENLMDGIEKRDVFPKSADNTFLSAQASFALNLIRANHKEGENTLLSPISAMFALSMCANGADENTLKQMEQVLGKNISIADLNRYLLGYKESLGLDNESILHTANSIWFRDGLDVSESFLQTNADYYGADAYMSAFDHQTKEDVNAWVKEKTDGMIPEILDQISPQDMLFLINAISFDGKWETKYKSSEVKKGTFYTSDLSVQEVDFMQSTEYLYLQGEGATGFLKPYEGGKYTFAAILPDKGITPEEYLNGLDENEFLSLIKNVKKAEVAAYLPKFKTEYSTSLKNALSQMGMTDLFTFHADLSNMTDSENELYVSEVLQKTYISVDENGTRAAAVTNVGVKNMSAKPEIKTVRLDRPFLYFILDTETNLPLFMGIANSIQ